MSTRSLILGVVALVSVAGCGSSDDRQWMKINQRYTADEFRRDLAECSKGGKLDEECMRGRGWIAVSPRAETPPTTEPPRNLPRGVHPDRPH